MDGSGSRRYKAVIIKYTKNYINASCVAGAQQDNTNEPMMMAPTQSSTSTSTSPTTFFHDLVIMVAFDAMKITEVSRAQLVGACRALRLPLEAAEDKRKASLIPLVAKALLKEGIVTPTKSKRPEDCSRRSDLTKAKAF